MTNKLDKFFSLLEVLLGIQWIYGGINTFFANPISTPSPLYSFLVGEGAIVFYAIFFLATGLALLAAKFFKKKRLKSVSLVTMYLTCLYVFLLSILVLGPSWSLVQTVVVGVIAAACWLRWKFKTQYLNPKDFHKSTAELRETHP